MSTQFDWTHIFMLALVICVSMLVANRIKTWTDRFAIEIDQTHDEEEFGLVDSETDDEREEGIYAAIATEHPYSKPILLLRKWEALMRCRG